MSNDEYDQDVSKLSAAFRGLSDSYRLQVFAAVLRMTSEAAVGESGQDMSAIIDDIAVAQNTSPSLVEHHLLELQRAGLLVIDEGRDGRLTVRVDHGTVARARKAVSGGTLDHRTQDEGEPA
jgi:DNA-binding transcriptional ArsR family regulator